MNSSAFIIYLPRCSIRYHLVWQCHISHCSVLYFLLSRFLKYFWIYIMDII
ncbi:hypothetical protein MBAV_001358 [Candidatus Magnetobacterium bavaricum]|uniref:Uncharacterized protein n=1 Tax=Candidatus Magnetobacterium bavaricum TaxID=29290 RepID=A0A0F3GX69_9BACT|nr:hypothetical protein MBAV_001358 [Candidatus Magnetobacterium bavaricum]